MSSRVGYPYRIILYHTFPPRFGSAWARYYQARAEHTPCMVWYDLFCERDIAIWFSSARGCMVKSDVILRLWNLRNANIMCPWTLEREIQLYKTMAWTAVIPVHDSFAGCNWNGSDMSIGPESAASFLHAIVLFAIVLKLLPYDCTFCIVLSLKFLKNIWDSGAFALLTVNVALTPGHVSSTLWTDGSPPQWIYLSS